MSLVVLEGCDGAGKSTFAERLKTLAEQQRRKVTILHKGPPDDTRTAFAEYTEDLAFYEPSYNHKHLVICDRWHLGEIVYGPIYRGGSKLTPQQLRLVDTVLDSLGALKLILDADDLTLMDRAFGDRGEDFLQREHLARVANSYRTLARDLRGWQVVRTDLNEYHLDGILKRADRYEDAVIDRGIISA